MPNTKCQHPNTRYQMHQPGHLQVSSEDFGHEPPAVASCNEQNQDSLTSDNSISDI